LTPEQCTVAVSAATETPVSPDVKNMAAAAAIAAFDNLVICMMIPSFIQAQRYCCSCTRTAPVSILLLLPALYYLCRPLILLFASSMRLAAILTIVAQRADAPADREVSVV
jgi:hypothetical protein